MDNLVKDILNVLDIPTLLKLKERCNAYITYSVDYKQINSKYNVQTRTKQFAELLEEVEAQLVLKGFNPKEQTNKNTNNAEQGTSIIKSSMENETEKKSRKKEKKE